MRDGRYKKGVFMSIKKEILLLGYGEMGHAIQTLLEPFHEVSIWNRSTVDGKDFLPLESLVPKAEIIIFCLPVNAHEDLVKTLLPLMDKSSLCISIAKGLNESALTAAEIFKKSLENFCLIYGPMIAEELSAGKVGFAEFGCSHPTHEVTISELYNPTALHLKTTDDITGISWSVILKNVYALAFGMIDELEMGKNVLGYLTVMALDELDTIAESLGGKEGSSYGLAGLGDLITTGSSEDSRHHTLGRRIARGDFSDMRAEGTHTLLMVEKFKRFEWEEYPLFITIKKIASQEIEAKSGLESLFKITP